jgi:hypothetical protein
MNTDIMKKFKRTNIALAIFFNIITFDFYGVYWLEKRRAFLNSHMPSNQLPFTLIILCYILLALSIFYSPSIFFLYFVVKLLLLLEIRNNIHSLAKVTKNSDHWISAFFLLLFGFLYLIYKIDRFPSSASTPDDPNANGK